MKAILGPSIAQDSFEVDKDVADNSRHLVMRMILFNGMPVERNT